MPNCDTCNNIYNDCMAAKAIIMAGIQQSSITSFVNPPLGSWEHFVNNTPTSQQVINNKNKDNKDKNNDNKHKRDIKRPKFDSG